MKVAKAINSNYYNNTFNNNNNNYKNINNSNNNNIAYLNNNKPSVYICQ